MNVNNTFLILESRFMIRKKMYKNILFQYVILFMKKKNIIKLIIQMNQTYYLKTSHRTIIVRTSTMKKKYITTPVLLFMKKKSTIK